MQETRTPPTANRDPRISALLAKFRKLLRKGCRRRWRFTLPLHLISGIEHQVVIMLETGNSRVIFTSAVAQSTELYRKQSGPRPFRRSLHQKAKKKKKLTN
jgi:hypothetical protein